MAERPSFVIVGAGAAGGSAAAALRDRGFDGRMVLIGAESRPPYERPPLSKDYLRGETSAADFLLREPSWYEDNDVELRLDARVDGLDVGGRAVALEGGEQVPYDRALLATGGRNRAIDIPGADLEGILQLRTVEDSDAIRDAARGGGRAVVVGAGFIGMEVAASLRTMGVEVEVVEIFDAPLARILGSDMGRVIEGIHRDRGVSFRFDTQVARFEGSTRVERVVTASGDVLDCDFVVAGIGILPNVEIAAGTPLAVDNGIRVDARCRTNVAGVFAAGDVANHDHPVFERSLRVEHFDNAIRQGAAAARSMLGEDVPFDDPHWFWSDQYEHTIDYSGFADAWDEIVVRGSLEARSFVGFYMRGGRLVAAVGVDRGREVRRAKDLIKLKVPVDPAMLRDEDVDLKRLAADLAAHLAADETG